MTAKKRLCLGALLGVLFFLGLYLLLIWPSQKRDRVNRLESANKITSLRGFLTRPEGPPDGKDVNRLAGEIKILEEKYKEIEKTFIPKREETVIATPVEFGNILHQTKKELQAEARRTGLKIPADLGFKETIPGQEEVKIMTRELAAIKFLIARELNLGTGDIEGIKYLGLGTEGSWEKVSLELSLAGEFGKLVEFLCQLSQDDKIFVLTSLEIKKDKGAAASAPSKLKAGVTLSGTEVKKEERGEAKVSGELITAIVSLDSYTYLADHGN